jgi:hypothetical protein
MPDECRRLDATIPESSMELGISFAIGRRRRKGRRSIAINNDEEAPIVPALDCGAERALQLLAEFATSAWATPGRVMSVYATSVMTSNPPNVLHLRFGPMAHVLFDILY